MQHFQQKIPSGVRRVRRVFHHRAFLFYSLLFLAALCVAPAVAQESPADDLVEGRDYILLNPPQPVRAPKGKIEVLEFFNFSCPHCFRLQGPLSRWQKENDMSDVVLIHQPVVFQRSKGHYARLFHTLDALGVVDKMYDEVFNAIHRERKLLNSKARLIDWLEDKGMDGDKAEKIYESFSVNTKAARDEKIATDYEVSSTPQMAVAGKYLLSPGLSGSAAAMLQTLTQLIARERQNADE